MILAFKKGLTYKGTAGGEDPKSDENKFPLMNLPLAAEGEEMELNDFQWWAYSDRWQRWLDANPREWQAESEDRRYKRTERIVESATNFSNPIFDYAGEQIRNLVSGNKVVSFSSFINEGSDDDEAARAVLRKFQKLTSAVQKLIAEGTIKADLKVEDFPDNEPQAVIVDFLDEDGEPVMTSRSALRITKKYEVGELILCDLDYTIPAGEVEDPQDLMEKTMQYAEDALFAIGTLGAGYLALTAVGGLFTTWTLAKTGYGIYKWARPASLAARVTGTGGLASLKNFASTLVKGRGPSALAQAGRVTLPSSAYVEGGIAYSRNATGNVALRGASARSVLKKAATQVAARGAATAATVGTRAAATGGAGAIAAAEASNPVGWVIAALSVIGSGVNQLWNWYSDKQAPRFGEVDSFAYGTFTPKNIPMGKAITVCWTSDGGAGWGGFFLDLLTFSKDDTRTTMELVKIGELGGRSIFVLLQVNSEMLQKITADNDIVMLSFANSDKFERGYLDNDDLEFQISAIPSIDEYTIGTSLVGYCGWKELQNEYSDAPDYPIYVPGEAKEVYRFNYTDGDGKRVNVEGILLSDSQVEDLDLASVFPVPGEGALSSASVSESVANEIMNESKVISFAEFSSVSEKRKKSYKDIQDEIDAEMKTKAEVAPEDEPVIKGLEPEKPKEDTKKEDAETAEEAAAKAAAAEAFKDPYKEEGWEDESSAIELASVEANDWGQYPVIVYKVDSREFVDPNEVGDPGDYDYFVVDDTSIDPIDGDPIMVEVTSLDEVRTPRYGYAEYVEPPKEEEEDEDTEGEEVEISTPGENEVKVDDLVIKTRKNSTVLKDKDARGGTNPLEEFGSEELRRDLGIGDWGNITYAKVRYNRNHEPTRIVLKNNLAKLGDRKRVVKAGELGFDAALKFAARLEGAIKYA